MTHKNRNGLSLVDSDSPFRVMDEAYYSWADRGVCRDETMNPDLWFTKGHKVEAAAKHICKTLCPVAHECYLFALTYMQEGIWGGTDDDERKKIRLAEHIQGVQLTTIEATKINPAA